jgi:hypothetical protein
MDLEKINICIREQQDRTGFAMGGGTNGRGEVQRKE